MTVQPNLPPTNTLSDGTTTTFPYNFKVLREEHLKATFTVIATGVVTDLEIESYTGIEDDSGGTVTFATAPADDGIVTLDSIAPLSQIEEFNGNKLPPETVERMGDAIAIQNQRQQSQIERSVRFPSSDSQIPTLPAQAQRADKIIGFDATGANFVMIEGAAASQSAVDQAKEQADRAVSAVEYPYATGDTKTVSFMPVQADDLTLFRADSTGGAITVTLDEIANLSAGYNIGIYRVADGETVTVQGSNGDLINGQASIDIDSDYLVLDLTHDGSEWIAADKSIIGLPVGTAANNILALNSEAKIPAVDGSLLTNVIDAVSRDVALTAYIKADIQANDPAGIYGGIISDNFVSDTAATKTNFNYNAAGDYYTNALETQGTTIGLSSGASWNGNTWVSREFLVPNGGLAVAIGVYLVNPDAGAVVKLVQRVSAGTYDVIVSKAINHAGGGWQYVTLDAAQLIPGTGNYYVGVYLTSGSNQSYKTGLARAFAAGNLTGSGVSMTEDTSGMPPMAVRTVDDGVLVSSPQTISPSNPDDVSAYFRIENVDSATIGTDITVDVSIDGGSTYQECSLTEIGAFGADDVLVRADADVSAQTGSSYVWKIETMNSKVFEIKQVASVCGYEV